jgi:hypothetical protein
MSVQVVGIERRDRFKNKLKYTSSKRLRKQKRYIPKTKHGVSLVSWTRLFKVLPKHHLLSNIKHFLWFRWSIIKFTASGLHNSVQAGLPVLLGPWF